MKEIPGLSVVVHNRLKCMDFDRQRRRMFRSNLNIIPIFKSLLIQKMLILKLPSPETWRQKDLSIKSKSSQKTQHSKLFFRLKYTKYVKKFYLI